MHMLPLTTASTGYWVFNASWEPYQNPKTMSTINPMTMAVWTYSFFHAQHCAETGVTFWAFIKRDFKLHPFSRFVWSSSHFPSLLRLRDFGSTFWTFSHL